MKNREVNMQAHISERGQSIILIVFAFVTLLIAVGLAIDLGLVYIERVRLGRAVDAAALGAVQELPNEEAAFRRALMFLKDNGYDFETNATIYYNGGLRYDPAGAAATIYINTADYREEGEVDTAMRIEVKGERGVPLNFMKFAGQNFSEVMVPARAVAENVQDLDVVVVFDRSGSMEFDTICYGCWEVDDGEGYDYDEWAAGDEYSKGSGERGGVAHALSYPHDLCPGTAYWDIIGSDTYIVIEAEHYTTNFPTFDPQYRTRKTSYWGLQRNGKGSTTVGGCSGYNGTRAGCGGYMQHNPFGYAAPEQVYTTDPDDEYGYYRDAPKLVYDFRVPGPGRYYVWLRAQGGSSYGWGPGLNPRLIHWGVDDVYKGSPTNFEYPSYYEGATNSRWRWRQVGYFDLGAGWDGTHALDIWAGGHGFRLDKIAITDDSSAQSVLCNDHVSGCWGSCSNCYRDKGPDATEGGRDGYACWECNPLYGKPAEGSYCEGVWQANPQWEEMYAAMFDDKQPVRASKEAVKLFVDPPQEMESRLEPKFDQIGFVSYSGSSTSGIDQELECVKRLGAACTSFQAVLDGVEIVDSGGSTNTGSALWDGIRALMNGREGTPQRDVNLFRHAGEQHWGRPGTSRFIILLTDGNPTASPPSSEITCPTDLWPEGRDYDCAVHLAEKAREQGIILYAIGLGESVDENLLTHMADVTNGAYFPAPDKEDLNTIFMEILNRIYIRLIE